MSRRVEIEPDVLASDKLLLRQEALTPEVCTGAASCYRPTTMQDSHVHGHTGILIGGCSRES